jgi:putative restriction endonuclease
MKRRLWTREEMILVLNLYMKLPFSKIHDYNSEVIKMAGLIGRSPASVAMRLGNYASCDPLLAERNVRGLADGRKRCMPYWEEFQNNREDLLYESECIRAKYEHNTIEHKYQKVLENVDFLEGKDRERLVKTRVNQSVFREMVLNNYSNRCALTDIDLPELLVASHIIPWSVNEKERLNPANGICLSALYDAAFDKGLIGFRPETTELIISERLKERSKKDFYEKYFGSLEGRKLNAAEKYKPSAECLDYHLKYVFH